jgi:hypothetical protein
VCLIFTPLVPWRGCILRGKCQRAAPTASTDVLSTFTGNERYNFSGHDFWGRTIATRAKNVILAPHWHEKNHQYSRWQHQDPLEYV